MVCVFVLIRWNSQQRHSTTSKIAYLRIPRRQSYFASIPRLFFFTLCVGFQSRFYCLLSHRVESTITAQYDFWRHQRCIPYIYLDHRHNFPPDRSDIMIFPIEFVGDVLCWRHKISNFNWNSMFVDRNRYNNNSNKQSGTHIRDSGSKNALSVIIFLAKIFGLLYFLPYADERHVQKIAKLPKGTLSLSKFGKWSQQNFKNATQWTDRMGEHTMGDYVERSQRK